MIGVRVRVVLRPFLEESDKRLRDLGSPSKLLSCMEASRLED